MNITSDGKWIEVEPVETLVAAVAARILELRLADVRGLLPLAAHRHDEDVEHVHQLRVSCRRAAATLAAFAPLVPRGAEGLGRWLKRIRRAAGPPRDADVLIARLAGELDRANPFAGQVLEILEQARIEVQSALVEVDAKAARGGFYAAIEKALRSLRRNDEPAAAEPFAVVARRAVAAAAAELNAVDVEAASLAELHQLRLAGKHLRYSIEIFHSAAPASLRNTIYPQVEEMQERLGALNDRAVSQQRFQLWLGDLPGDGLAAFAAELVVHEHAAAARLQAEFLAWWTRPRRTRLRERLAVALA